MRRCRYRRRRESRCFLPQHCTLGRHRPYPLPTPIEAHQVRRLLDFADRARDFVPEVRLTAIAGLTDVDIAACDAIARKLGVAFYSRSLDDI